MSFHDYNADYARRKWGFKTISSFDILPDISKRKIVCHNMNILKDLPSEIKLSVIKKCIKNKSDDYVGLDYLNLYRPRRSQLIIQENLIVEKDRKSSDNGEKNCAPSQIKSKKVMTKLATKSTEDLKRKGKEHELHIDEQDSRNIIPKSRGHVKFIDSEKEDEEWVPPTKKGEEKNQIVVTNPTLAWQKDIKGKRMEHENHVAEPVSRNIFSKKRAYAEFTDSEEDGDENWTAPKKKKEKKNSRVTLVKPLTDIKPELPDKIKGKIQELNGSDIRWLFTKRLFSSDVNKKLGRFSMPSNQIDASFLRDDEMKILDKKEGIEVRLVGPTGGVSKKVLKKWDMWKTSGKVSFVYNLISGWSEDILKKNVLEVGQLVHIWSFREGTNLSLALVKVDE